MAELDVNLGSGSGEPTESEAPTRIVFYSRKYGFNKRIAKRLAKKLNVEWVGIDV